MRGLFTSYNKTLALYQQAEQNVLARKDADADKIAVAQIAKLQSLTPTAPALTSPMAAPKVVSSQPVDYGKVAIAGGVLLGLVTWIAMRK